MKLTFKNITRVLAHRLMLTRQSRRVRPWFRVDGDNTLRLDYPLNRDSIVFDVGGYHGDFAQKLYERQPCKIFIFEPVPQFYEHIHERFSGQPDIQVFPFGLAGKSEHTKIHLDLDRSSVFATEEEGISIELKSVKDFFEENSVEHVDLMKINIEGAEYDLLEHIFDCELQHHFDHLQIQFHDFVSEAESRMLKIQKRLEETHSLQWQYKFVWESWKRKLSS